MFKEHLRGDLEHHRVIKYVCCNELLEMSRPKNTDKFIYHHFNIQKFYVLPTQDIYVFCVDLRTNSDYFPIQH